MNGTTVSSPSTSLQRSDSSQPMLLRVVGSQTSESMGKRLSAAVGFCFLLRSGNGELFAQRFTSSAKSPTLYKPRS